MKRLILMIVMAVSASSLFCESLNVNMFFKDKDFDAIKEKTIVSRMYIKFDARKESTDLKIDLYKTKYLNVNSMDYELILDEKTFLPYDLNDVSKLKFYNILSSFEGLKGMGYYSRKAGKVEQLVTDCYRTDADGKKITDPDNTEVKDYSVEYFKQKDNKFGTLKYKSELYNEANNFVLINTCMDSIKFVSNPGEYVVGTFFIYDENKKGFYMYSIYLLRIRSEIFIKGGPLTVSVISFSNRLRAGTVQIAKLVGVDWSDKLKIWKPSTLKAGKYRNY